GFSAQSSPGVAGTAARLIHGHPHRLAALSGSKWGVAMASLISRAAVVAAAAGALLIPAGGLKRWAVRRAGVLRAILAVTASAAAAELAAGGGGTVSSGWPTAGRRRSRDGRVRGIAARMSVLLAAVILAGVAGIPASASARGWSVTPSPNPVIPTGQLFCGSCPAANSCMAGGTYTHAPGPAVTLAEQ